RPLRTRDWRPKRCAPTRSTWSSPSCAMPSSPRSPKFRERVLQWGGPRECEPMQTDIEDVQTRHRRRQARPSHDCPDQPEIGRDIQYLIDELTAARGAVARLTEDDQDLRGSAEIWCRLYEAALERASSAEAAMARARPVAPDSPAPLYDALERVADLTHALGGIIRECA